jgi:CHAD domain-containing protein
MHRKSKKNPHLEPGLTVSATFQAILRHNLDYLEEWEQTARSWEDIEGVHQTRVAFRRMRSALTVFRLAIPKAAGQIWSDQMRELGNRLGRARDLDVFIDEALGRVRGRLILRGGDRLLALAEEHRAAAYEDVRAMLEGEPYAHFKQGFRRWLDGREWERAQLKGKQQRLLEGELIPFARKVLDRQERRVLEAGAHVDKDDAAQMHRLRIECKKLRYAAEFFTPLFAGMDEFIGHMKGLQDLLGVMNDVAVMRGLLDQILDGISEPEVPEYAGGIVGWRACEYYCQLDGFEQLWEEFTEAKHPWWKKGALAEAEGA